MYCVCQALGPTKKKLEEQEHGKENPKESQEARSHQAVDHIRSLKVKSGCKHFVNQAGRASALPVFFWSRRQSVAACYLGASIVNFSP